MKKDVLITIKGTQNIFEDNQGETIEFITNGQYHCRAGNKIISYNETELTGLAGVLTTVKVEGNERVTITRSGKHKSQLILEKGTRHLCHYTTAFGDIIMGVKTANIISNLNNCGGEITAQYSLELNHSIASDNSFNISIKEANYSNGQSNSYS